MPHIPHPSRPRFDPRPMRRAVPYPDSLTTGPTWPVQRWLILHGDPEGWVLQKLGLPRRSEPHDQA